MLSQFNNKCNECGQYLTVDCDDCKHGFHGDIYPCDECIRNDNHQDHYKPKNKK